MKISCEIIKDVLPLYVEDIANKHTRKLVEEHLDSCLDCRKELEEMKKSPVKNLTMDTDAKPLKKIRNIIFKNKLEGIVIAVLLTLTLVAVIIAYLTTPNYLPYSNSVVDITGKGDGTVLVEFSEDVTGYDIERYKDESGYHYTITAWDSFWGRNVIKKSLINIVLNPRNEKVTSVYYYQTDGSADILVYGKNLIPDGGVVTLPRLALSYYLVMALIAFTLSALLLILFRRNEKAKYWLIRIVALSASYLIGHLLVKGFNTITYTLLRDFISISMVAVPLYIAFLLVLIIFQHYKSRTN